MKDFFKNLFQQNGIQPILTVVLIIIIVFFAIQFIQTGNNSNTKQEVEITKKVSLEDAANKFLADNYEIRTRGSLYVKDTTSQNVSPSGVQSTPTPSITQISLVENKYDDVFFLVEKGKIIKVDAKTFGINGSIFFNKKGQLIFLDSVQKKYTLYKIPADTEKDAVALFEGIHQTFNNNILPLTSLIQDYKNKKFNPTESTTVPNVYSGKWQHPVYTNNEITTVVIQTDPNTGLFTGMAISGTNPPSQLYFEFTKQENIENYDVVPEGFQSVPVPVEYKSKG